MDEINQSQGEMQLEIIELGGRPVAVLLNDEGLHAKLEPLARQAFENSRLPAAVRQPLQAVICRMLANPADIRNTSLHYDNGTIDMKLYKRRFGLPYQSVRLVGTPMAESEQIYNFIRAYDRRRASRLAESGMPFTLPLPAILLAALALAGIVFFVGRRVFLRTAAGD